MKEKNRFVNALDRIKVTEIAPYVRNYILSDRKSVLHLLKYRFEAYLSRCRDSLRVREAVKKYFF